MINESLEIVELGEAEDLVKFSLVREIEPNQTPAQPEGALYADDDE